MSYLESWYRFGVSQGRLYTELGPVLYRSFILPEARSGWPCTFQSEARSTDQIDAEGATIVRVNLTDPNDFGRCAPHWEMRTPSGDAHPVQEAAVVGCYNSVPVQLHRSY